MQSKITLIGMYNFDNSLFDGLTFPTGIDRDLAIDRILNKSEEFELVYSDFDYLQERIEIWAKTWERTFKKWVDALSIDYDPLYNYDRKEIYTDTRSRDYKDENEKNFADNHSRNYENSQTETSSENSSSISNTVTGSETSSNTEQKKSAYDEAGYSDRQKETAGATTNQTGSGNASGTITGSVSNDANSNEISSNIGNEKAKTSGLSNEIAQHEAHLFGNIGVTTSQQMLESELNIATWNLYEHISDIFIDEFCILVY